VTHWNAAITPTLYVLDHKGIIRDKCVGNPGAEVIDAALDTPVEKAE
jgi:hypothetical protein